LLVNWLNLKSILISGLLLLFVFSALAGAGCKPAGYTPENASAVASTTEPAPVDTLPVETPPTETIPVETTPTFTETPPATPSEDALGTDRYKKLVAYLKYYVNSSPDVQKDLYMRGLVYFAFDGRLIFQYDNEYSRYKFPDLLADKTYTVENDQIRFGPGYAALSAPVGFLKDLPEYQKLSAWYEDYIRQYLNSTLEMRQEALNYFIGTYGDSIVFDFYGLVYCLRRGILTVEDNQIKMGPRYAVHERRSDEKLRAFFIGEIRTQKAANQAVTADLEERANSQCPVDGDCPDVDKLVAEWMDEGIYYFDENATAFDYKNHVMTNKEVLNFGPKYDPPGSYNLPPEAKLVFRDKDQVKAFVCWINTYDIDVLKDLEKRGFGRDNVFNLADLQGWVEKGIYQLIEIPTPGATFQGDKIRLIFGPQYVPPETAALPVLPP
jgi:hypothetical protein